MAKPLHQRLREIIPQKLKDVVPEHIKERIRPPAWRDPKLPQHEFMHGERGELRYVLGDEVVLWPKSGSEVTLTKNSKGEELPAVMRVPVGTKGRVVALGPTFVVVELAGMGGKGESARFQVDKVDVLPTKSESERKWGRRRVVTVTVKELVDARA